MKKIGTLFMASLFLCLGGCNKNDDSRDTPKDDIMGIWRLMERIENDKFVSLGICELKEVYMFGPEQYSHETFRQDTGKYKSYQNKEFLERTTSKKVILGSDDDYYTEIDNTIRCKSDGVTIGTWSKVGTNDYQLKETNAAGTKKYPIYFSADKKKLYLEKETYFGGRVSTSLYVFKRQ
ncbi:MAG: hypothetical protein LBE34_14060 [Flavobacteriaceae bacterium]|jgi:hypothetical protein|nr:hypothetical protein [Flavobacteriaceae bacterium]